MRQRSAEALLLNVVDLHDRDRIVTFLTCEWGKKKGVARGARRKYSRYAGQLQPLAKVEVSWFEKDGRELVRIQGVEVLRSAHRLQEDLEGILLGAYLADHLAEFAQEDEASDHLFRLLDTTLAALLQGVDRDLAARYFESWVLRLAGIFPPPRDCPLCATPYSKTGAVLPRDGEGLICARCAGAQSGGTSAGPEVVEFLLRTSRENLESLAARPPPARVLRQVEGIAAQVRRGFLQRELKSYDVMQRTLGAIP